MTSSQPPTTAWAGASDASQHTHAVSFVTARLGTHWFALPITDVWEVFPLRRVTQIPRAPRFVRGLMNLRGRIVTVLDTCALLDLPATEALETAIGIEVDSQLYGLAVATIGDVLCIDGALLVSPPPNLDPQWRKCVRAIHRHDERLVMIVDVGELLGQSLAVAHAADASSTDGSWLT